MTITRRGSDPSLGNRIEIRGVGAGPFDAKLWRAGKLNLVRDTQSPLLTPHDGLYRNIYAPSVVRERDRWRIFYGAWDGIATGNDCLYQTTTRDFRRFDDRRMIVNHGDFVHVCNVSAVRPGDGSYRLMATSFPDASGLNKPVTFTSPDSKRWNSAKALYKAQQSDYITLTGDPEFATADINGLNVLLYESGLFRLYFSDFKRFGTTWRATSTDGKNYTLDGPVLRFRGLINDVKRLGSSYVMALHTNGDTLFVSLSDDGRQFAPVQTLLTSAGPEERYIVSVGLVADHRTIFGVLYGAGATPSLDQNRIFARWLQKRVAFVPKGSSPQPATQASSGPERVRTEILNTEQFGNFRVYDESGVALLWESPFLKIHPHEIWELKIQ